MYESDALPPETGARPRIEGVRLRNAWMLQPSGPADFDWTPANVPGDFLVERRPPPALFARAVENLRIGHLSDWDKARALAGHLTERAQDRGPIRSDLATTYRAIRAGYGHCADFVKVYVALAHAAGLFVRQWAFSHNGFGGNGHVFVEVWDAERAKWAMLDVYNNFHVLDPATRAPLSALEFRDCVLGLRPQAAIERTGPGRPGFVHPHKLWAYYRRGAGEWYLIWGNAVYSYDAHPLVRIASRLHPAAAQCVAALLGVQPGIRLYLTAENRAAADALARLHRKLRRGVWVFALGMAGVLLLWLGRA
ncbi:MAG: transglutaminase domain-containing protein [Burkholderiales bacterium]|nr:transglutaminase domain-containing protein [Burkholderiales bacterium]